MATPKTTSQLPEINVPPTRDPRVVVIGGGFGGINFTKGLKDAPVQVVMLDQNNFHQFQPLLYQVATCGLEPDSIIFPLRKLFQGQDNFYFRLGKVADIDADKKVVHTEDGWLSYDKLVLATGSDSNFFGNDEIETHGIGMKDIRESIDIRTLVLSNLEAAASSSDPEEREAFTNFVIVGGGPAGVEMAGALAEFKNHILVDDFRTLDIDLMKIFLVQSGHQLLKGMSEGAGARAAKDLEELGVTVVFDNRVSAYDGLVATTNKGLEIPARCLVWTAGVCGQFPDGLKPDAVVRGGRLKVDELHRVADHEDIYAIGDVACMVSEEEPYGHPMVAQGAIQHGENLAKNIRRELRGDDPRPFVYNDKGSMATVGKRRAVADIGRFRIGGFLAWAIWCFVHVVSLVGFRNRASVFVTWFISYFTQDKGNRFIVDDRNRKE